jgi:hypothetical protein
MIAMTNYRYQGFNPSLEKNNFNADNVKILVDKGTTAEKVRYDLVFKAMQGFKGV